MAWYESVNMLVFDISEAVSKDRGQRKTSQEAGSVAGLSGYASNRDEQRSEEVVTVVNFVEGGLRS